MLRSVALVASVLLLVLVPDVRAADPGLVVGPVSVTVPDDPVLVVDPGTISVGVADDPVLAVEPTTVSVGAAGEPVLVVETGSISVGGSDPVPAPAPAPAPTPAAGSSAGGPVAAAGSQGVSKSGSSSAVPVSSVINTTSGQSVSAQGANGVRITKVRYITKNVYRTGRVTMIVTVKDRRGLLVRGAKVRIRGVAKTNFLTLKGAQTKTTTKVGVATFSFMLNKRAHSAKSVGKRFVVASIASTPTATTSLVTSFRVPSGRAATSWTSSRRLARARPCRAQLSGSRSGARRPRRARSPAPGGRGR
ncbi:MAG: hypothetical protein H0V45_14735 [Actinobacteria bacterium]|nr:hypothetical protein [Actinomycetota bacterium]